VEFYLLLSAFSPELFLRIGDMPDTVTSLLVFASPLSHAFIHVDFLHFAVNGLFILAFATRMEKLIGTRPMLTLYLLSALAGALAVTLTYWISGTVVYVIGASGAASGLLGAYIRLTGARVLVVTAAFIFFNILLARTGILMMGEIQSIAWDAHIGGYLAGLVLIRYLLPQHKNRPKD
jgi:membrane associated rhomboid family serine protease